MTTAGVTLTGLGDTNGLGDTSGLGTTLTGYHTDWYHTDRYWPHETGTGPMTPGSAKDTTGRQETPRVGKSTQGGGEVLP